MDIQTLQTLIGSRIKELRQARGWSQHELAERARISADFVSQAERGRRAPSMFVLTKLCDVLGVQPAFLVSEEGEGRDEEPGRKELRLLLEGRSDAEVRLVSKLARAVFDHTSRDDRGEPRRVPPKVRAPKRPRA